VHIGRAASPVHSWGSLAIVSSPEGSQLASQSAAGHGAGLNHARQLIQQVNKDHDLQTSFINIPKPDPRQLEFWRHLFEAIGKALHAVGEVFAPLKPVLPFLLYGIALAAVLILLSPVARLFITTRFERLFARDHLRGDASWRPTKAAVTALLSEIDALAAQGRYDEAVHLLLIRSVADINAFRPDMVRLHYSARDILSHPLLPAAARPAFKQIVEWVEKSYFAGVAVGKAGFDACRRAYVDFVAAEGIA
jgi:hypothetical protein